MAAAVSAKVEQFGTQLRRKSGEREREQEEESDVGHGYAGLQLSVGESRGKVNFAPAPPRSHPWLPSHTMNRQN